MSICEKIILKKQESLGLMRRKFGALVFALVRLAGQTGKGGITADTFQYVYEEKTYFSTAEARKAHYKLKVYYDLELIGFFYLRNSTRVGVQKIKKGKK